MDSEKKKELHADVMRLHIAALKKMTKLMTMEGQMTDCERELYSVCGALGAIVSRMGEVIFVEDKP